MKTAILDAGGGMRGIYTAGIYDFCLTHGLQFDLCIGVSAGSANLSSLLAGQAGRNHTFYTEYCFRREYMSVSNLVLRHAYANLDYAYGTLSRADGENPLDYAALRDNLAAFYAVATDARTGLPHYFDKSRMHQDDYDILKASCTLPVVSRPYVIDGVPYLDGALSDPIPVQKALELGCDKLVLAVTRPLNPPRSSEKDEKTARRLAKQWPAAAEGLRLRAARYNAGVALAQRLAEEGRALILSPDDITGVDTLTKNKPALERLYQKGLRDAGALIDFLQP